MKTDTMTARPARAKLLLALGAGLAGLALLALRAPAQDPAPDEPTAEELAERVDELEEKLAASTALVTALGDQLAEVTALVDQTVLYLNAQAKSAEQLARVLEVSEQEGFTFGINPRSREVLLAGWRDRLRDIRTAVPGAPTEEESPTGPTPPLRNGTPPGGKR